MLINILVPIFLLILLGYFFKTIGFPHTDFWKYIDKFNYFVLFPSLLVYKLSTANMEAIHNIDFVITAILSILFVSVVLIIFNKFFPSDNSAFTSIYQGGVRFNTYVFLAVVDGLFGDMGLVIAAFLITFLIPLLNVLSIGIFAYYISEVKVSVFSFLKSIFKNPLILACLFGGSINFLGLEFPTIIQNTLSILTLAALPLGLLSVGVGLHLSNLSSMKKELFISSVAKLIILPLCMFTFAFVFQIEGLFLAILILFATMPTATSAYTLATELGGDTKLISSIISFQTIISIITISIFLQFIVF